MLASALNSRRYVVAELISPFLSLLKVCFVHAYFVERSFGAHMMSRDV
jgi:hypothetical protein